MRPFSFVGPLGLAVAAIACAVSGVRLLSQHPAWAWKLIAFAVALLIAAILLFRARQELRVNLSLTIGVLGLGLIGFETYLALRKASPPDLGPSFDTRSPMQVVRDMRAAGRQVEPSLLGTNAFRAPQPGAVLPVCGIATSTTVFCNELGEYLLYESDEHGFNNPRPWPERADVVVIGDSYAHGNCVERGQDVAGRLRAKGFATVNLGCSGSGPLHELAALVEYAVPLRPKFVVWFFYEGNDIADFYDERKSDELRKYLLDDHSQGLWTRQPEVDAFWRKYLEEWSDPREQFAPPPGAVLRQIIKLQNLRALLGLRGVNQADVGEALSLVLKKASALATAIDARFVFVYVPSWQRFHDDNFKDMRTEVLPIARGLNVTIVDFAEELKSEQDIDRLFPHRRIGHFNADGYARLADAIERHGLK